QARPMPRPTATPTLCALLSAALSALTLAPDAHAEQAPAPPPAAPSAAAPAPGAAPLPAATSAPAPSQPVDPARVRGIERQAFAEDDAGREAAAGVLFVPRELVKLMFLASGLTAGLIRDQQIVPRVEEMISPRAGSYSVIPSLFLDTRRRASVGAELIGNTGWAAMRLGFGFGGVHDLVGEARFRMALPKPLPFVFSVEGMADS